MAKVSIKNLEEYGHSGWKWVESFTIPYDDEPTVRECRTNQSGGGLFRWSDYRASWVQELGTCQFSLSRDRENAYQQIRRYILGNVLQVG